MSITKQNPANNHSSYKQNKNGKKTKPEEYAISRFICQCFVPLETLIREVHVFAGGLGVHLDDSLIPIPRSIHPYSSFHIHHIYDHIASTRQTIVSSRQEKKSPRFSSKEKAHQHTHVKYKCREKKPTSQVGFPSPLPPLSLES